MEFTLLVIYSAAFFAIFSSLVFLFTYYENRERLNNPRPKKIPSVTVIVPAFNEEGRIKRTVDSLLNLAYPKQLLEIILVDDGSKDNTWKEMQELQKQAPQQIRIFTKKNGGKASALNLGIEKAKGEITVSLDADSFVDKQSLMRMVGYFDNPKVMAVTPSMKVWKPKSLLQKIQFVEYLFGIYLRKAASFMGCIHVTPGPFSAYRKSFFKKYGGYQEGNLTEDIEVALRIQSNNFIIENARDAYSYTISPSRFKPLFTQRLRWYLGFLNNCWNYRHLFSRQYGTLGVFFLPSAFLSVLFTIFLVGYTLFKMSSGLISRVFDLWSINFDIWQVLQLKIDAFYLTPGMIGLVTIVSLLFATAVTYMSKIIGKDKEPLAVPFVYSLFLYAPLYALWWTAAFLYKARGKTITWSGVVWKKD
jgi:cellulose synthase/poly-beta-1,6-N-acetylglucosamine synthase-like glycosyltransferase